MDQACVTVVIAARDAEETVADAVRSALAEPETAEVVLIDDGSKDATAAIAEAAADGAGRLLIRRLPCSVGPAEARNVAIDVTHAPFIAVLDADDTFLPGRLGVLVEAIQDADLVADDVIRRSAGQPPGAGERLIGAGGSIAWLGFSAFVLANLPAVAGERRELGYLKPIMRRAFLARHRLAYDASLRLGEDFILYAQALAAGARFKLTPAAGYIAGIRPDSLSRRHGAEELAALLAAEDRLLRQPDLEEADRRALARHRRHTAEKLRLRQVLDARRAGGLAAAARAFVEAPEAMGYIVGQVLSDRLRTRRIGRAP